MLRPRGGGAIAESMTANVKLSVLDLSHCGIQDAGASALGDACRSNQVCTSVDPEMPLVTTKYAGFGGSVILRSWIFGAARLFQHPFFGRRGYV